MKFCPQCQTTYSDDTLVFCLSDGTKLVPVSTTEKTVAIQGGNEPLKVKIPSRQISDSFTPPTIAQTQDARRGISPWLVFPLVGILFLSVAGLLAYIFFRPSTGVVSNSAAPIQTATPVKERNATDNETTNLREELESLKKQVANQKTAVKNNPNSQKNTSSTSVNSPAPPTIQTARANSPNDGFLALRSIPDATNGEMLAKIPHGTNLEIIGCQQKDTQLPGKLRGRWCRTNYNGQDGWVFDAFLKY